MKREAKTILLVNGFNRQRYYRSRPLSDKGHRAIPSTTLYQYGWLNRIHPVLFTSSVIHDTAGLMMSIVSETPFYGVLFDSASEFIAARALDTRPIRVKKRLHINKPVVSFITERARLSLEVAVARIFQQNGFSPRLLAKPGDEPCTTRL